MPMTLAAAQDLARRGFHVFPIRKGGKKPAHNGWQDEATNDPDRVAVLWGKRPFNVGVSAAKQTVAGEAKPLVVVDVDCKNGKDGNAALRALAEPWGGLPATFTVRTPSGGLHLYFRASRPVGSNVGTLAPGVDVRGVGGYAVGPGSEVAAGAYTVAADHDLADCPEWLEALLPHPGARNNQPGAPTVLPGIDPERAAARATEYLRGLPTVTEGGRNDAAFAAAVRVKELGCDPDACLELMLEHWSCEPMLHTEELRATIASAYRNRNSPQGADAPEAIFEPVEIEPKPAAAKPARYELLSVETLIGRAPPPWLVRGLLPAHGMGVVYGAPGSGKSFLVLDMAAAIARGAPWAGQRVKQGAVVYVALEGQMSPRVSAYLREQQLQPRQLAELHIVERQGLNLLAENFGPARQLIADIQAAGLGRVALVVVDTLNRSMPGGNENASEDMGRAIHCAGEISRALDCLCVFVHHSGKDATRGARGHSSLLGAADAELEVSRGADGGTRFLEATKVKDGEDGARFSFRLKSIDLGPTRDHDPEADEFERDSSCVVEGLARVSAAPAGRKSRPLGKHAENALRALRDAIEAQPSSPKQYEDPHCSLEAWRDRFFEGWPIEEDLDPDARRKATDRRRRAFEDAREALKARGLIEVRAEKSNFSAVRIRAQ